MYDLMLERIIEIQVPISFSFDSDLQYDTQCTYSCLLCNKEGSTRFGHLLEKTGCVHCNRKLPESIEHAYNLIDSNLKIISLTGVKKRDRITLNCVKCDNIWETSIQAIFHNGTKCPRCNINERKRSYEDSWTKIVEKCKAFNNLIIPISYKNKRVTYKCKLCDNINIIGYVNFLGKDHYCSECQRRLKSVITKRKNEEKKLNFKAYASRFASQLEAKVALILIKHGIVFETQKKFKIKGIESKRFDFFLPEYNCVIEVHGLQHYEQKQIKWGKLEDIKRNDKLKSSSILGADFKYIEIPYNKVHKEEEIISAIKVPFYSFNYALDYFERLDNDYFFPFYSTILIA